MATVLNAGAGMIDVVEGTGPSLVILTVLIVVAGAAAYFTGRLFGQAGLVAVAGGFVIIVGALYLLGAINFG